MYRFAVVSMAAAVSIPLVALGRTPPAAAPAAAARGGPRLCLSKARLIAYEAIDDIAWEIADISQKDCASVRQPESRQKPKTANTVSKHPKRNRCKLTLLRTPINVAALATFFSFLEDQELPTRNRLARNGEAKWKSVLTLHG
jgi:hypothetical protein